MRGLRFFTSGSSVPEGNWLDDPQTFPTWEACGDLGIAVDAQVRITGLDKVRNMLERYPEINIILDHLAFPRVDDGPPYEAMKEMLALSKFSNLYLKCSENNIRSAESGASTSRDFFSTLIRDFGANRIMWGSNYPASAHEPPVSYKEIVDHAREALAFLPSADRDLILGGTARNLYPDLKGEKARVG
jgi:predicted TIM-barrel fold metal-dependent hydrolase